MHNLTKTKVRLGLLVSTVILLYSIDVKGQQSPHNAWAVFHDKSTGWTAAYPPSWNMMLSPEIDLVEERGKAVVENVMNEEIVSDHTNLLWLKKDRFNAFVSIAEPFDTTSASYRENQYMIYKTVVDAYKAQHFQFDYKLGTAVIDDLEFNTMETILYTPDRSRVLMTQIVYDRLVNGNQSLTLSINFNNDEDKAVLMNILQSSKFSVRN